MKIEKTDKALPVTPSGGKQTRASSSKSAPTSSHSAAAQSSPSGDTSVQLGTKSAQLQEIETSIASAPLVNASKVAEIKQAISEGRFQVNSGEVADQLIETVKNLIRSHKP